MARVAGTIRAADAVVNLIVTQDALPIGVKVSILVTHGAVALFSAQHAPFFLIATSGAPSLDLMIEHISLTGRASQVLCLHWQLLVLAHKNVCIFSVLFCHTLALCAPLNNLVAKHAVALSVDEVLATSAVAGLVRVKVPPIFGFALTFAFTVGKGLTRVTSYAVSGTVALNANPCARQAFLSLFNKIITFLTFFTHTGVSITSGTQAVIARKTRIFFISAGQSQPVPRITLVANIFSRTFGTNYRIWEFITISTTIAIKEFAVSTPVTFRVTRIVAVNAVIDLTVSTHSVESQ